MVDWYHAKEHLAAAVRLLRPESDPPFPHFSHIYETLLYQGHARQLADALEQTASDKPQHKEALKQEAHYFRNNHRRMNYMQLHEDRWLTGSGMVERGAKQFKHRLTGPGMRWSRQGFNNLLPIRAAVMSQRFDELWQRARQAPKN